MRIERVVNYITTLGPGSRLCIWVNGCSRKCVGCVSPNLQNVDESTEVDIYECLYAYNLELIDGVTISGGEPFEQAEELYRLVRYIRRRGIRDILVYTGYTYDQLKDMQSAAVDGVLEAISVLIDGPYVEELDFGVSNIKGSDNQEIHYLDPSVRKKYEAYIKNERNVSEMILANVFLGIGIPCKSYVQEFNQNGNKSKN